MLHVSARKEDSEITEWYSVEDIQSKYGMTLSAIYSSVSKIGIPATITKVTLRKEKLHNGKLSLYLDYYPPIGSI